MKVTATGLARDVGGEHPAPTEMGQSNLTVLGSNMVFVDSVQTVSGLARNIGERDPCLVTQRNVHRRLPGRR